MKVRTQTILGITPIFVALGAAIGVVMYTTERAELTWSLEEEVSSLAVSIAEFYYEGRPDPGVEDLGIKLNRERIETILDYGQLERVRYFEITEGGIELSWAVGDEAFDPRTSPSERDFVDANSTTGYTVREIQRTEDGTPVASSLAPVRNAESEVIAYIEALVNASRLEVRSQQVLWRASLLTLGLSLVGYLLSVGISRFLTRRLSQLERASRIVAEGGYDQEIQFRTIKEVNDLGGTFNTMSSIIRDTLAKARSQLVEAEQFREPEDLASASRRLGQAEQQADVGPSRWLAGVAGSRSSGAFAGLVNVDQHPVGLIGRVAEDDPLESTTRAQAAQAFLGRLLEDGQSFEAAVTRVAPLFDLEACQVISSPGGKPETLRVIHWEADGTFQESTVSLGVDEAHVITTDRRGLAERIRSFITSAGNLSARDVAFLLSDEPLEGYFVVQPAGGD